MTVSLGNGVDIGNLVTAETNPLTGGIEVFGVHVVTGLSDDASANTEKIQAALDSRGDVLIAEQGDHYINDTLIIYSDTRLQIAAGARIVMTGGIPGGKPVLENYAYTQRANGESVTFSWSSGTLATVTFADHGLSPGDCFVVQGATESVYNAVHQVLTVTDANTVTVRLNYTPSAAPSGTLTAIRCDKNITLDVAGTLNYNHPLNTAGGSGLKANALTLAMIENLHVPHLNVVRAEKYAVHTAALLNAYFGMVNAPVTDSDIVKCYGPMKAVVFESVSGYCGDDGISFQPHEADAYPANQWIRGDILDCHVTSMNVNSKLLNAAIAVLYPSGSERMQGIHFGSLGGNVQSGSALRITAQDSVSDTVNDVTVGSISAWCRYGVFLNSTASNQAIVRSLVVNQHAQNPSTTDAVGLLVSAGCNIDYGDVQFAANGAAWTGGVYLAQINGTYHLLKISGELNGGVTARGVNMVAAQTGHLVMSLKQRTGDQMVGGATVSGTITLQNCETQTAQVISASGVSGTVEVNLCGNRFNNASGGVVRSTTGTFKVRSESNHYAGTSVPVLAPSGTPVFELYGLDMRLDVGATGMTNLVSGQYCFNSGVARGTLVQNRLVTCDGTNWRQMDTPANIF